jgi:hypothetical protein
MPGEAAGAAKDPQVVGPSEGAVGSPAVVIRGVEEPEASVVVRAWKPRGAQTQKELSGRADKPTRWKSLQERQGSQW